MLHRESINNCAEILIGPTSTQKGAVQTFSMIALALLYPVNSGWYQKKKISDLLYRHCDNPGRFQIDHSPLRDKCLTLLERDGQFRAWESSSRALGPFC